jgi:hypothetical protein
MNWKEQFDKRFPDYMEADIKYRPSAIFNFISTEIIGKLIEDIPDEVKIDIEPSSPSSAWSGYSVTQPNIELKQQLRDKWL